MTCYDNLFLLRLNVKILNSERGIIAAVSSKSSFMNVEWNLGIPFSFYAVVGLAGIKNSVM